MNCWNKYSYYDYEEAYCHSQYYKCKEIGIYILSKQKDEYSRSLLERLEKFEYDWLHPDTKDADLLWAVKMWLMQNVNYF